MKKYILDISPSIQSQENSLVNILKASGCIDHNGSVTIAVCYAHLELTVGAVAA